MTETKEQISLDNIKDENLKFLIENKKINARIQTLIEVLDKTILNQFFIAYYHFTKSNQDFKLAINFSNKNISEIYSPFHSTIEFYAKLINRDFDKNKTDKTELYTEKEYPFDCFGSNTFLYYLYSVDEQSSDFFPNFFNKQIRRELAVWYKDFNDFVNNIIKIQQLRHYLVHNGSLETRKGEIKFHNGEKELSIIKNPPFTLLKSLQSLFLLLPEIELSELIQLIKAERDKIKKKVEKNNEKDIDESKEKNEEQDEFIINIDDIYKWTKQEDRKNIKNILEATKKDEMDALIKRKSRWNHNKLLLDYGLYTFIKRYNFMGELNIFLVDNLMINLLKKYESPLSKNYFKNISFEETYKIFNLIININEIIRNNFLYIWTELDNFNEKELKEQNPKLFDKKGQILKEYKVSYNKMKIKSKQIQKIRNEFAHANMFFKMLIKTKTEAKTYEVLFHYYIKMILSFFDYKYNETIFNNWRRETNYPHTFQQVKLNFVKQLSSLLLHKDYCYLYITEPATNKKGEKIIKKQIKEVFIANDKSKDVKTLFEKKITEITQKINDNPQRKGAKIEKRKWEYYYFLKCKLMGELNKVKDKNKKTNGKK